MKLRKPHFFLPVLALAAAQVAAQPYPAKPVRVVVSYAPGNVTDVLARIVAENLGAKWKMPVVVENRPGQGGSLGAQIVAKAPADGYTLLFSAMAALCINPHVYPNLGYDVTKDFVPVVSVAYPDGVMIASVAVKAGTLSELIAYSKANPGTLNYGSAGSGTVPHLNMEALKAQTGLDATHVPYKGATAVMTDLVGGRVQLQQESLGVVLQQIKAKRIKAIVAMSQKRLPQLPELPAITEVLPGFDPVIPWLGILAPAGTPAEVVDLVYRDVGAILRQGPVIEKLQSNSMSPIGGSPKEFGAMVGRDLERLGKLVRALNLKVD